MQARTAQTGILEGRSSKEENASTFACKKWEAQCQLAELLARLSADKESALRLIRVGAFQATVHMLHAFIFRGARCDITRAFLTVLPNLVKHVNMLDMESVLYDSTAHSIVMLLEKGDTGDFLQFEFFREGARALRAISSFIGRNPLKQRIKAVLQLSASLSTDSKFQNYAQEAVKTLF